MSTLDSVSADTVLPVRRMPPAGLYVRITAAMLERDAWVVLREWPLTVARVTMQPLLFVFVFAYLFPLIGQGVGGAAGSSTFASLLVPGTLAMTLFLNGIQAVTLPMIEDLGTAREIQDRASCPLPLGWLAGEKIIAGAVESFAAAPIVAVCAAVVPRNGVRLDIDWGATVALSALVSVAGAALGLFLGVAVRSSRVQAMFTVLVLPMTFLGASYYPWAALGRVPWLQWLITLNPMVYANECLRAVMAPQIPHMNLAVSTGMVAASVVLFSWLGGVGLRRRLADRTG